MINCCTGHITAPTMSNEADECCDNYNLFILQNILCETFEFIPWTYLNIRTAHHDQSDQFRLLAD